MFLSKKEGGRMNNETADDYCEVICRYDHFRIIRCKDDIQYILQRRIGGRHKWPRRALAYIVCESSLPAVLQRGSLEVPDGLVEAWNATSLAHSPAQVSKAV